MNIRTASAKRDLERDYAILPNEVLWRPPISHRRTSSANKVAPLCFYILGGILIAARAALVEKRHAEAMARGAAAISKEAASSKLMFEDREWAGAYGRHEPTKKRPFIVQAGQRGYKKSRCALRKKQPRDVAVDVSRRQLLRLAGLYPNASNFRSVCDELDRLHAPVGDMVAPLADWVALGDGRLRLVVDGAWLPVRKFKRVLWPPPKRSPAALALWLLVRVLNTSPQNKKHCSADWLADRLGVEGDDTSRRNVLLASAFRLVNDKLRALPDAVVERLWRLGMTPPGSYECDPYEDGKIRIVSAPRKKEWVAAEAEARPVGVRLKTPRVPMRRLVEAPTREDDADAALS